MLFGPEDKVVLGAAGHPLLLEGYSHVTLIRLELQPKLRWLLISSLSTGSLSLFSTHPVSTRLSGTTSPQCGLVNISFSACGACRVDLHLQTSTTWTSSSFLGSFRVDFCPTNNGFNLWRYALISRLLLGTACVDVRSKDRHVFYEDYA